MIVMMGGTSCSWGVNCLLVQTPPKMMGGLKSGAVAVTENVSALRAPDDLVPLQKYRKCMFSAKKIRSHP